MDAFTLEIEQRHLEKALENSKTIPNFQQVVCKYCLIAEAVKEKFDVSVVGMGIITLVTIDENEVKTFHECIRAMPLTCICIDEYNRKEIEAMLPLKLEFVQVERN